MPCVLEDSDHHTFIKKRGGNIIMLGGFTFKGIHSSVYGVRQTPSSRVLSPLKRRSILQIPGRSRGFIQEDGGYEPRVETILCTYARQNGVDLYEQVRQIAGWLDGVGQLTYDHEPTLHYNAYLSSSAPTVKMLEFAQFELEFTMAHPFAYETAIQQTELIGGSTPSNVITVETDGTIKTPVRFIITNNTDREITELKIYHRYIES